MAAKSSAKSKTTLSRAPIVAVMGHVDHGKTSLLDAIRGTSVQSTETGGITQNTRAHQITYKGQKITFIDTPGHEAFSDMRSRGAKVTDLVLLVVAADDGVQPQTKESIKFAQQEKVPILVAINKIDLPHKSLDKLKQQLANAGLLLEEYGGDVLVNEVSAIKKKGINELLDSILLLAEMSEVKFKKPDTNVEGTAFVLESTLDKNLGPVALVLMKSGELKQSDVVVFEDGFSKVRAVLDDFQKPIPLAIHGDPAWIVGLKHVLPTGAYVNFVANEKIAKDLSKEIVSGNADLLAEEKKQEEAEQPEISDMDLLASLMDQAKAEREIKYLNLVIKTDTQGTLEAVTHQLLNLNDESVQVKILDSGTGSITEKDIMTARTGRGIVIGFQVDLSRNAAEAAKKDKVLVRVYSIIYELIDEIAGALESLVEPVEEEVEVARSKVKEVFVLSNKQRVAGSEVTKGTVIKGYKAFVERDGERIGEGKISSLKHLKQDVKEVKKGQECGIILDPVVEVQAGDEIVCFKLEKL